MKIERVPTSIINIPDFMTINKFNEIIDFLAEKYPEDFKDELKPLPCPFCGEEPKIDKVDVRGTHYYSIVCKNAFCDVTPETVHLLTKREVVEIWNRRAGK